MPKIFFNNCIYYKNLPRNDHKSLSTYNMTVYYIIFKKLFNFKNTDKIQVKSLHLHKKIVSQKLLLNEKKKMTN